MPRYFGSKLTDGIKEEKKKKNSTPKKSEKRKRVVSQSSVEFEWRF